MKEKTELGKNNLPINEEKIVVRGNDDKLYVDGFFSRVIRKFNNPPIKNIAVITANHLVPTLQPYKKAIEQCMELAAIILKGSPPDEIVPPEIARHRWKVSRAELATPGTITKFIKEHIDPASKFVFIDIGAYFAPCFKELEAFGDRFLGGVEDTENGHQVYQTLNGTFNKPIISVARSKLKDCEDLNVGVAIAHAVTTILRDNAHTTIKFMKIVGVIGFGKIGTSAAMDLANDRKRRIIVYDKDPLALMRASALGFEVTANREDIFKKCDTIFCMTGKKSLVNDDFLHLRDNVFIASCTSADTEFDLTDLKRAAQHTKVDHIDVYTLSNGKTINLLHGGEAVNFIYKGVNGPSIYGVQAGLIVSAIRLAQGKFTNKDKKIDELSLEDQRIIADLWNQSFEQTKHKKINNLPPENTNFFGRESELQKIKQGFSQPSEHYHILSINGLGGMGKTQLAKAYAHTSDKAVIWWFDMSANLDEQFRKLAIKLNKNGYIEKINQEDDLKTVIKNTYDALALIKKWLFVFDNLEEHHNLDDFLPLPTQKTGGSILLTSQHRVFSETKTTITLGKFARTEAIDFVKKQLQLMKRETTDQECGKFIDVLDEYPLLIIQAIAYLQRNTNVKLQTYLNKIAKDDKFITRNKNYAPTSKGIEDSYNKKLEQCLKIPVSKIKDDDLKILQFIVLLHPVNIPEALIKEWGEMNKIDEFTIDVAISRFKSYCLLESNAEILSMHRLVQTELERQLFLKESDYLFYLETSLSAFVMIFDKTKELPLEEKINKYSTYINHFKCVLEVEVAEKNNRPNKELLFRGFMHLGAMYHTLDNIKESCAIYEKAKVLLEKIEFDKIDIKQDYTVKLYRKLGNIYPTLGKYDEAKDLLEQAYDIQQKRYGEQHKSIVRALLDLARWYCRRKDLPNNKAIEYANRAHDVISSFETSENNELTRAKEILADSYRLNRQYEKTLQYYDEALSLHAQLDKPNLSFLIRIKFAKAAALKEQKKQELALPLLQEVLKTAVQLYGYHHHQIRAIVVEISKCFKDLSKFEEGKEYLFILEKTYNENTSQPSAKFLISLAQGLQNFGDEERCLNLYARALQIKQNVTSEENDIDFSTIYSSLGYLPYKHPEKFDECINFTKKALAIKKTLYGEHDPRVATEYRTLARTYKYNENYKKFETEIFAALEKAYQIDIKNQKGYKINQRQTTLKEYIDACDKFRKTAEKAKYEKELSELRQLAQTGKSSTKRKPEISSKDTSSNKSPRKEGQTSKIEKYQHKPTPTEIATQIGTFKRKNASMDSRSDNKENVENEQGHELKRNRYEQYTK